MQREKLILTTKIVPDSKECLVFSFLIKNKKIELQNICLVYSSEIHN